MSSEPHKSDVLLKREQILRERDARANATSTTVHGRSEPLRNSTASLLPERSTTLPSRPDAPIPPHRMLLQTQRVNERRDGRDARDARDGRDGRDGSSRLPDSSRSERPSERSRDFVANDRRDPGRDFMRPSDRESLPPRDRSRPDPPPRWTGDSARENAEKAASNNRNDTSELLARETNMPPPRSFPGSADRGPSTNPERIPLVNSERQELINPERAALISGEQGSSRSESPRRTRDEPRDRTSSRPQSPRRHGSDRDFQEARQDDRKPRNGPDIHALTRRIEESQPPAGPRGERSTDRTSDRASTERPRDYSAFQSSQPASRQFDPEHGRLNSSSRSQPDPNFGRLNAESIPEVPLGPRGARGNRLSNIPQPSAHRDGRLPADAPRATTPERQVPTGPSSTRQPRRSASGQFDQHPSAAGSAPSVLATASLETGIHPDRLKHLGPQVLEAPSPTIHPDRLKAFSDTAPSSLQMHVNGSSRPPLPTVVTGGPPSGPKQSQPSPISSGPSGISVPTGPASSVDRAPRSRRQLGAINTMLQQAQNGQDRMNIRGRNNRMGFGAQPETPNSAPGTPIIPPASSAPPGRPELPDLVNPERVDLINGGVVPPRDERERDRMGGRYERSGRHSHRSSRSPPNASERARDLKRSAPDEERPRDAKRIDRGPPEDERLGRGDHRERRGGDRETERDRHQGREPRELTREQGRDFMMGRDRDRDKDRDRDSARRDGRNREGGREPHDAIWTGGSERGGERGGDRGSGGRRGDMRGDPRGEERRDGRGSREDANRKRRSDGDGIERGHDKRLRR